MENKEKITNIIISAEECNSLQSEFAKKMAMYGGYLENEILKDIGYIIELRATGSLLKYEEFYFKNVSEGVYEYTFRNEGKKPLFITLDNIGNIAGTIESLGYSCILSYRGNSPCELLVKWGRHRKE